MSSVIDFISEYFIFILAIACSFQLRKNALFLNKTFLATAIKAEAKILKYTKAEKRFFAKDSKPAYFEYEFKDEAGKFHVGKTTTPKSNKYKIGDVIEILYNPSEPEANAPVEMYKNPTKVFDWIIIIGLIYLIVQLLNYLNIINIKG